jgi:hypothetical protein
MILIFDEFHDNEIFSTTISDPLSPNYY